MSEEKNEILRTDRHLSAVDATDNQALFHRNIPRPRDLMRVWHPDLYSDTRTDDVSQLPKSVFEYHLDTLTSRKQEYQFEHFCLKLAEREICPNLCPQTGPTGGGDSKVDSETYPVAEEIAERWWIGTPSAGKERWAFAFSAKKDWKSKVKADVKSILSTERDYKLIYFFTNQFVSDKARSECEDTLSKDAGVPVRIIDRFWIVEKVYEADHQQQEIYFTALGIEDVSREKKSRPGPRDTARLEELERLDKQVADPSRYQGARYQLAEDCLRRALLARGLERSRSEVEARFLQADRLAQDLDHNKQRLRIAYNRAWTAFWWYEDYSEFSQFYDIIEQRAEASIQASDVELLQNLWTLLLPLAAEGGIEIQDAKIEPRSQRLTTMLEKLATDSTRPNNALQARTGLIMMRTMQTYRAGRYDEVEDGLRELDEVVDKSEGLGAYSVEHLYRLVKELGESIDSPAFDALYEKLADAMRVRRSEGEAGMAYVKRAQQKMGLEKPYEAIHWFGRAEELLIKKEYRRELVMTLVGVSRAFESVGLLWAARNKALAASDLTLGVFAEKGRMIPAAVIALNQLAWIELKLGRIPHILDAITLEDSVAQQLNLSEEQIETYAEKRQIQEEVLSIHILNLPLEALSRVASLPSTLQRLGLDYARMALLFVLGYEHVLREEGFFAADIDAASVQAFFEEWRDCPASKDISSRPELVDGQTSVLKSTILGSEIVVKTPNNEVSFGIAESLLSTLEAFLSTCNDRNAFPYRERVTIFVTPSAQLKGTPQIKFPENDSSPIQVTHPADMCFETVAERQNFMEWLKESLLQIACRMLMIQDVEAWVEKVINQERGFSRALKFGDNLTLNRSVLGEVPRIRLTDWLEQDGQSYDVLRDRPWRAEKARNTYDQMEPLQFGSGPPPVELLDKERLKHTDRRILSPIDVPLWNRAQWRGTLFAWSEMPGEPPILAIGFEDGAAGQAIFRSWQDQWGKEGIDNVIRVAVITGLSVRNPAMYSVVIGPDFRQMAEDRNKLVMFVSRMIRMTPNTSENLEKFIAAYKEAGSFCLAPVWMDPSKNIVGMPSVQLAITKRQLDIREAWQIGENDPDISALHEDDDPIVPAGGSDPPINKALRKIRAIRER